MQTIEKDLSTLSMVVNIAVLLPIVLAILLGVLGDRRGVCVCAAATRCSRRALW